MVIGSIALNMYWFCLMVNTVKRAIMRMNETEEGAQPKENIETAKLVKANAIKSDDMEFG